MADVVVPELGESITEAVVGRWLKKVGEPVAADEPLVDLETDKVTVQLPAPEAGSLSELRAEEGDTVTVGQVIASFQPGDAPEKKKPQKSVNKGNGESAEAAEAAEEDATPEAKRDAAPEPAPEPEPEPDRRLTPSQRKALRETGKVPERAPDVAPIRGARPATVPASEPAGGAEDVVPMTSLRKRIAERLVKAQQTAAILTTFNEVDMTEVMALRAHHKAAFLEKHGVKLGFMSFFVKACVAALRRYPGLNAEVKDDSIVYKKYYNVGVAVGGGKGLVVPVVRAADQLGFAEIESTILELAGKARDNTLSLDELMGGTFTITNGGIYGSMMSTPLLNFPQTGILGMHNIVKRPMAVGDSIELRPMMYIALSYDHRVVDGREAVQFLVAVKERIEQPDKLMFDL